MSIYNRILIVSALEEEVRQLINAVPAQTSTLETPIKPAKDPKYPRGYYRKIIDQKDLIFDIFGLTGDIAKYDFVLEITLEGLPGVILLVDQDRPETYEASKAILALLHSYNLEVPIIVVDISPISNTELMREQLGVLEEELFLNCNLKDLKSIKNVILTLVRLIPEYAENQELLIALSQL